MIAEELGVVGLMVLLAVYLFIVFRAMSIAKMAFELNRYYQAFLAYGVGFGLLFKFLLILVLIQDYSLLRVLHYH